MSDLPERPRSHVLETLSDKYFKSRVPSEWIVRDLHVDYGIDCNVEITDGSFVTGKHFSVQLKGTDAPMASSNFSVSLKRSTFTYMTERPEPVMVVLYSAHDNDASWSWCHEVTPLPGTASVRIKFDPCRRLSVAGWAETTRRAVLGILSRVSVDRDTSSQMERFGRYHIDLRRASPLWKEEVDVLEQLVTSNEFREQLMIAFIESHPQVLLGGEYIRLHAQLKLHDSKLRPDYFLESVNGLCDILEVCRPSMNPQRGRHNTASLRASYAIAQIRQYAEYFDSEVLSDAFRKQHQLDVYRPRQLLLMGRDFHFESKFARRRFEERASTVRLFTYDDVVRMARAKQIE